MQAEILSTTEIAQAANLVALLPIGAFEQHGPRLPLATDSMIATGVVERVEQQQSDAVVVFPTIWFGDSIEHNGFAGTLSVGAHTLMNVLEELFIWLEKSGFTRVILYNAHGGNVHLTATIAEEYSRGHALKVKSFYAYTEAIRQVAKELFGVTETHGGSTETSLLAALCPQINLVDGTWPNEHPYKGGGALSLYETKQLSPDGILDRSATITCSREKGELLAAKMTQELSALIHSFTLV
jgi:creatinine amidohydrolase